MSAQPQRPGIPNIVERLAAGRESAQAEVARFRFTDNARNRIMNLLEEVLDEYDDRNGFDMDRIIGGVETEVSTALLLEPNSKGGGQ